MALIWRQFADLLTQYGTVDELAMSARYAQIAGKAVVVGMQLETAYVSIEKLGGTIGNLIGNFMSAHDIHPIEATEGFFKHILGGKNEVKLSGINDSHLKSASEHLLDKGLSTIPPSPVNNFPEVKVTLDGHGAIAGVKHLQEQLNNQYHGDFSKAPKSIQDFMSRDATKEAIKLGLFKPTATNGLESSSVGQGSTLGFDKNGNLLLHDTFGHDDTLIHVNGDASQVEQYHEKMFHYGHNDITHSTAPENTDAKIDTAHQTPPVHQDTNIYTPHKPEYTEQDHLKTIETLKKNIIEKSQTTTTIQHPSGVLTNQGGAHATGGGNFNGNAGSGVGGGWGGGNNGVGTGGNISYGEIIEKHARVIFPGASETQNNYLLEHSGFFGNKDTYDLGAYNLIKLHSISNENIGSLFKDPGDILSRLNGLKANSILENSNSITNIPESETLKQYFVMLKNFSGLKPEGGIFRRNETAEHFMGRALQKLMAEGKLDDFETSLKK